ncbi:MAG: formyltransferase family protein [Marinoscillum sp.]
MSEKGLKVLKGIIDFYGTEVIDLVVIGRDNAVLNDFSEDIEKCAKKRQIETCYRNDSYVISTSYALAISWRWMIELNERVILITLHDSLLPKYRGFAPLVSQLINGENSLGVSAIKSSEEFDRGDIISQAQIEISYPIKIQEAIDKVVELYVQLTLSLMESIISNEDLLCHPQDDSKASYSLWRDEDDYKINWAMDAQAIIRFVNAVGYPYKGAKSTLSGINIRILDAYVLPDVEIENRTPGKVLFIKNGLPVVVCGKGLLQINQAIAEDTQESVLPLSKLRVRFS